LPILSGTNNSLKYHQNAFQKEPSSAKIKIMITQVIIFLLVAFLGYIVGRWADYVNALMKDPAWLPHHWIPGLILMVIGFFYLKDSLGLLVSSFGTGFFISDLKDFLNLKFFEKDEKNPKDVKFWNID
jgi:putative Mn2+ efflux pump MntP